MVVLVPAAGVIETLASGAAAGARSATVFSAGFGEAFDAEAAALGRELARRDRGDRARRVGPELHGQYLRQEPPRHAHRRPPARRCAQGPVALVGQSGGMMIFANPALEERGISARYLITSGNEAGLSVADYIAFFAERARTEGHRHLCRGDLRPRKIQGRLPAGARGRQGHRRDQARPVGRRPAGGAGAYRLARRLGRGLRRGRGRGRRDPRRHARRCGRGHRAARPYRRAGGRRLGAITLSGAFRGLLLDAAETQPPDISTRSRRRRPSKLNSMLTVGSLVSNPIDGGFGVLTSADNYMASIEALQADPNIDMVLLQEALPREPGSTAPRATSGWSSDYAATKAQEADRLRHADLARPDRLQPRAARQGAACVVPAGGQQGAARHRQRRAARRSSKRSPRGRRRRRHADGRAARGSRAAARARAGAEPIALDEVAIEGRAARLRHPDAGGGAGRPRRRGASRPPSASAIRSCSRRCRRR